MFCLKTYSDNNRRIEGRSSRIGWFWSIKIEVEEKKKSLVKFLNKMVIGQPWLRLIVGVNYEKKLQV